MRVALPAGLIAAALMLAVGAGIEMSGVGIARSQAPLGKAYADTYYVNTAGVFLAELAAFYLGLAAAAFVVTRFGRRALRRLLPVPLASFHLGVAAVTFAPALFAIPWRYADYPSAFARMARLTTWGSLLSVCGLLGTALLLIALLIPAFRRIPQD